MVQLMAGKFLQTMNPIPEILTDEQCQNVKPFLSEVGIRNHQIQKRYKEIRKRGLGQLDTAFEIQKEYPYLNVETIIQHSLRRIYRRRSKARKQLWREIN